MPFHIPGAVSPVVTVKMVGPIVQWASALLLLGIFALLIPLASQRRAVMIWMTAWLAEVVGLTCMAMTSVLMVFAPHHLRPEWIAGLDHLYWPAKSVFLAAIAVGAIGTVRAMSAQTVQLVLLLATILGMVLGFASLGSLPERIELVAMPLVCFGAAQVVLFGARAPRSRGLIFLGLALTLFGTVSTFYLLAFFENGSTSEFANFVRTVSISSGYGDALVLSLLAAAVIVVTVQDSLLESSRVQAERLQALASSEQRLNGIIEAAREAIIIADEQHRIDLVNGAAAALFQIPARDAVGRPVDAFILDASSLLASAESSATSDAAELTTHVGCGVRSDGSSVPLEFTVGRLDGAGRRGSVLVLRDLTARNAAQAEREEFDRRMAESEKMLAIGRVVSGVAHELNNPLAVVLGQSEQLAGSAPTGELRSGLRMIYEQANRARHIVKDLLAFVRHQPRPLQPVNLGELVQHVAASQVEAMNSRGVTLLTDVPSGLPPVIADRQAIEQILVNLID
ncbi:MAG: two-component system sensor histidine kinase NtrB, partial [Gemmatimonadales bacterium]